ncbi:uncharacterized protein LOC126977179 isoform X2 [Leptidea sinapis]|uniref:uncharacterized protein LOC126977179 isoform X2 n=1 Tax=Leptidea sinapis TaxID=189913 RepID=UPI0021C4A718|nr:uncharacterized protein LOC126977179 isoform X2 [Leptidea sinapis]
MSETQNNYGGGQCTSGEASQFQPSSNDEASRGRGRGSGRGRRQLDSKDEILKKIQSEKKIMQRRIDALQAESRQELMARKRKSQLERMLLPDAPPRNRRTKKASPERSPCLLMRPAEAHTSTSGVTRSSDIHSAEPEPSTSGISSSVVVSAENCWLDDEDIGAEVVIGKPATSVPSTSAREVSYNDKNFDSVVEEWLQLTNLSDDDDDFSTNLLDDPDFITNRRNALTEPACLSDLSAFQAEVLWTEDERDDRAIRDIVPDDCYLLDWNKDRQVFKGQQEVFTATYGPTFQITDLTRPIDIF